jgi:hypothetical protein
MMLIDTKDLPQTTARQVTCNIIYSSSDTQ